MHCQEAWPLLAFKYQSILTMGTDNLHATSPTGLMQASIEVTDSGHAAVQGNIAAWKKQPGEEIAAGDVLCEVETDKVRLLLLRPSQK